MVMGRKVGDHLPTDLKIRNELTWSNKRGLGRITAHHDASRRITTHHNASRR